jgi:hypothetical protein
MTESVAERSSRPPPRAAVESVLEARDILSEYNAALLTGPSGPSS